MARKHEAREYTEKDVLWRIRDQFQLRAVLWPAMGRCRRKEQVVAKTLKLRKRWRGAVARLRRQGWDRVAEDDNRRRHALECPVSFLMVYGKPRSCTLRTACPFCWARQAAQWWDRVDGAFFLDARPAASVAGPRAGRAIELDDDDAPAVGQPRKVRAEGYTLVLRSRTWEVTAYAREGGRVVDKLRTFYAARTSGGKSGLPGIGWLARNPEVAACMRAIARPGLRSGCFENITTDLVPGREAWAATVRQVWMIPEGASLPAVPAQAGMTHTDRVVESPWRTQVMKAMAIACRYPAAMFSPLGDGGPAHQLVTARRGLRLSAMYGDFRNKNGRDG